MMTRKLLEQEGFDVDEAHDGAQARARPCPPATLHYNRWHYPVLQQRSIPRD
jgi:hypothetical protein